MKPKQLILLSAIIIMGLWLASCQQIDPAYEGTCHRGVCIEIVVVEPVPFNEPVTVTATVVTERDYPGLEIRLGSAAPTVIFDEPCEESRSEHSVHRWVAQLVDTEAGVPQQISAQVRFTQEGYVGLMATVYDESTGFEIGDGVGIKVTLAGGTVAPDMSVEIDKVIPSE